MSLIQKVLAAAQEGLSEWRSLGGSWVVISMVIGINVVTTFITHFWELETITPLIVAHEPPSRIEALGIYCILKGSRD